MTSLEFDGLKVQFAPPQGMLPDEEYVLPDRAASLTQEEALRGKSGQAVPSEVAEVVNLAADYDRWDQFAAHPAQGDE